MSEWVELKQIYLQPHHSGGETTWCEDRIHDDDIEYILYSEYDALQAKLNALAAKSALLMEEIEFLKRHGTFKNDDPTDVDPLLESDDGKEE